MVNSPIATGEPFTESETRRNLEQLQQQGFVDFGPVLDGCEVDALSADLQRKWEDPRMHESETDQVRGTSLMRMFEYSTAFRDLIVREPFASFAEVALGEDCHCMSQNALVTIPDSEAVAGGPGGWHVDDLVHFPLPPDVPRHDAAAPPPCFVLQVFTPLTDVEELRYGPTEVVPGSHHSGRRPEVQDQPVFESNTPHSFLTRKTHAYAFNNQIWHRGAPNSSDRTRLKAGVTYSKRFISQKFYPFIDYRMPEHVWEGASPRLQRMLGRHQKGAYG